MAWKSDLREATQALRRQERELGAYLARVQATIRGLERILGREVRTLSSEGRAAISRAATKRWREYRAQQKKR